MSSDGGTIFNNLSAGSPYSGLSSNVLTITGLDNIIARDGYQFKAVLNPGSSCPASSTAGSLGVLNVWKGGTSINWNTASNWSGGLLPTLSCENIVILDVTNQPVLSSGEAFVNSIIMMPGATARITGATLHIAAVGVVLTVRLELAEVTLPQLFVTTT